jgi:uncharacterized protein YktB (UPF0637 family)
MWSTHVFVQFAVIYESGNKEVFARHLEEKLNEMRSVIPDHFRWSIDHMQPDSTIHGEMDEDDFAHMIDKLKRVKKTEALCGIHIERNDPLLKDHDRFAGVVKHTFEQVMPLYRIAF